MENKGTNSGSFREDFVIKILDEMQESLANRNIVLELCREDVTDYDRGKVQGKIEMLSFLMNKLTDNR